jgi:RNA polymerase sigma-70 factor (ECF subfamily)
MTTPVVLETRGAGHLGLGSALADAPRARRPTCGGSTTRERVLDPATLGDHFDRLFRAAWALCGSREDAEDLVQDTYARVLARPRIVRNHDDLGYLMRALRNTFISKRRAAAGRPQPAGVEPEAINLPDPRTGTQPPAAAEAHEVFAAISALPGNQRDALVAIDVAGLSYTEAAKALRAREGTITSRLYRARNQVAKALSQPDGA